MLSDALAMWAGYLGLAWENGQMEDVVTTSWEEDLFLSFAKKVGKRQVTECSTTWVADIFFFKL